MPAHPVQPKTFFLNEQHEFSRGEKEGGGRVPQYAPINWSQKGTKLRSSLNRTRQTIQQSTDPLRSRRYFLVATPESVVKKESSNRKKAPTGTFEEPTNYKGEHSRVFRRLGIDLLGVDDDGVATVHATPQRLDQLLQTAGSLDTAGVAEQARWATIQAFAPIPAEHRADRKWIDSLSIRKTSDTLVELQPLLTRVEADEVMRAIVELLRRSASEALIGAGTDFSGRQWFRGNLTRAGVEAIARNLFSVQSLHPPIQTAAMVVSGGKERRNIPTKAPAQPQDIATLPVVAIFDTGIPQGHALLEPYRRGQYVDPNSTGVVGTHAAKVASCVVFGDVDGPDSVPLGACRYLDVNVAEDLQHLDTKAVISAMEAVVGAYPDVRVFNCSFGSYDSLISCQPVDRRERLITMRDLDNFIFARDVLVVVAAGNTPLGVVPATPYPEHLEDQAWQLGSWAMGFNTLTCGAFVGRPSPAGIAKSVGWPSPFTRVGPGVAAAPIPDFSAPGGDCTPQYSYAPGSGVWAISADGLWEDSCGTSFAAPLLAREAALALAFLQSVCSPGARPFAVTVKAFLALTAESPSLPTARLKTLAERTLGRGAASAGRLSRPLSGSAVYVWQGVLETTKDVARVQLPVPKEWLQSAGEPRLRLVWAWDPPVHDAVPDLWACRRLNLYVKPIPDGNALRGGRKAHPSHPLIDREFDVRLPRLAEAKLTPTDDVWVIELSYEEIAEYFPGLEFSPQQRVAFVAELFDASEKPVSPQAAIQKLPIAATMIRLGVPRTQIATPVIVKTRR